MLAIVESLKTLSSARRFARNEIIIREGDESPYSLYIILSGTVRVVKGYGTFEQTVVGSLTKGEFFGEMSLFLLKPRSATVLTSEETIVLEITQNNVYELMELNQELFFHLLKALCVRVDNLNARVRSLGFDVKS